nr:hypothetical protein [Methanobrevibacter arboriphilus]
MALSIPLLISVLVLMYNLGQNTKKNTITADKDLQVDVAEETANSITFTILLCVCTVLSLGILSINGNNGNPYVIKIFSFAVYSLLGMIILTILMILKRVQILISKSFE